MPVRPRQFTLPLVFALLGTAFVLPLAVTPGFPLLPGAALAAGLATLYGTVVWVGTAGPSPSPRRGAVCGALATLTGAVCTAPVVVVTLIATSRGGPETPAGLLTAGGLVAMLVVLAGLVAAVPAAAVGAAVATRPSWGLPALADVPVLGDTAAGSRLSALGAAPDTTLWQLGAVVAVVAVVAVGAAAIQYTDPTSPSAGGGPEYAGADAPAATQVSQAQARTRNRSHTATVSLRVYDANGSVESDRSTTERVVHDLETDRVRRTVRSSTFNVTLLYTEDGAWRWDGTAVVPDSGAAEPVHHGYGLDPYQVVAETDAPASVVDRTDETVTIRYPVPTSQSGRPYDGEPGNRTIVIDRTTGRLDTIRTVRHLDENGGRVVRTTRFAYDDHTVTRPDALPRPPRWHVFDLIAGPLNGETPLHG